MFEMILLVKGSFRAVPCTCSWISYIVAPWIGLAQTIPIMCHFSQSGYACCRKNDSTYDMFNMSISGWSITISKSFFTMLSYNPFIGATT